jgi:hypothetical protein
LFKEIPKDEMKVKKIIVTSTAASRLCDVMLQMASEPRDNQSGKNMAILMGTYVFLAL